MTCDHIQDQLLIGALLDAAEREHLATCDACQQTSIRMGALLQAAVQPSLNPVELGVLNGLAHRVTKQGIERARTRSMFRTAASYGVAASLGGAVVAALLLSQRGPGATETNHAVQSWEPPAIELAVADSTNDDVGFEVDWPTLNEGETP